MQGKMSILVAKILSQYNLIFSNFFINFTKSDGLMLVEGASKKPERPHMYLQQLWWILLLIIYIAAMKIFYIFGVMFSLIKTTNGQGVCNFECKKNVLVEIKISVFL